MNGDLERHDPLTADEERALDSLNFGWGDLFQVGTCDSGYKATRRQCPYKTVTAPTPGKLGRVILADWTGGTR